MSKTTRHGPAFLTLAAGVLLVGCSASPGGATVAPSTVATATAPGSVEPSVAASPSEDLTGQEITVALPDWANVPPEILADFTAKTGIKATINVSGFGAIHDKVAVAAAANTPFADVTEFDWTWTGQFASAGWYVPLDGGVIDPAILADIPNESSFSYDGHPYAVCYSNDFRIGAYNKDLFTKAGISAPPTTFDEVLTDLRALKSKGVSKTPLTIALSASEGTSSAWFLLTTALGGSLFDANNAPAFGAPASPGYKAFDFMVSAYREGLIAPGAISPDADADGAFTSGAAALSLTAGPDELVVANDPKTSQIVDKAAFMLLPGATGPGGTIGSPRGNRDHGRIRAQGGGRGVHLVVAAARDAEEAPGQPWAPAVPRDSGPGSDHEQDADRRGHPGDPAPGPEAALPERRTHLVQRVLDGRLEPDQRGRPGRRVGGRRDQDPGRSDDRPYRRLSPRPKSALSRTPTADDSHQLGGLIR